jgi:hypothetical protein
MLYDIQKSERDSHGVPRLLTDMVSSDKRRIFNRVKELNGRGQQCRVVPQYGPYLSHEEIKELDR